MPADPIDVPGAMRDNPVKALTYEQWQALDDDSPLGEEARRLAKDQVEGGDQTKVTVILMGRNAASRGYPAGTTTPPRYHDHATDPSPSRLHPCDHDECGPTGCRKPDPACPQCNGHGYFRIGDGTATCRRCHPRMDVGHSPFGRYAILRANVPDGFTPTGIEAVVCGDIAERQAKGIAKYGVTVVDNPLTLREWLQHAYEECLDQAVYLRRAIAKEDAKQG